MELKDYKKLNQLITQALAELEQEAINNGQVLSDNYDQAVAQVKKQIIEKFGFTVEDYNALDTQGEKLTKREIRLFMAKATQDQQTLTDQINQAITQLQTNINAVNEKIVAWENITNKPDVPTNQQVDSKIAQATKDLASKNEVKTTIVNNTKEIINQIDTTQTDSIKADITQIQTDFLDLFDKVRNLPPTPDLTAFLNSVKADLWNEFDSNIEVKDLSPIRRALMGLRGDIDGLSSAKVSGLVLVLDGGGNALTTGQKGYFTCPFAGTISAWNITVDAGTCTFDVWKIATGTAVPTVANTITASAKPAISTGTAIHSTNLTGWTISVNANDIFGFNLDAVATATKATLVIQINK